MQTKMREWDFEELDTFPDHDAYIRHDWPSLCFRREGSSRQSTFDNFFRAVESNSGSLHGHLEKQAPSVEDAMHNLKELYINGLISSPVYARSTEMVLTLFSSGTIYASIAPEDDGAIFYWRAGSASIQIDVESDGGFWWSVSDVASASCTRHGR